MIGEFFKAIKVNIIDTIVIVGIFEILNNLWQLLEKVFDGGIQVSKADTIIAICITVVTWEHVRKWYTGGIKHDL